MSLLVLQPPPFSHPPQVFSAPAARRSNGRVRDLPSFACFSCSPAATAVPSSPSSTSNPSRSAPNSISVASKVPLVDALEACAAQSSVASFHFPGHRRGAAAPPALLRLLGLRPFAHDLPELPELDNLFAPHDAIARAQVHAAALFGAESTFFLVNGSTCGVQAAIMATCSPGCTLLLSRNCHTSAFSGMVLSGSKPLYIMPGYDAEWDVAHGVDPSDVEQAFAEAMQRDGHKKIGAVLVTSPTYLGITSDIRSIAHICHRHNVPLVVDEAHGAHFHFHEGFPETALQQGADIVIQSSHKVLTSLTQSAMLHVQGNMIDTTFLAKCLQTLQSSSPSYLLLASLDAAREHASAQGEVAFATALRLAEEAREALEQIGGVRVLRLKGIQDRNIKGAQAMDPLRITVGLWDLGLSGFEVDDILRLEYQVVAELPLLQSITFAINMGTTPQDIHSLVGAIKAIAQNRSALGSVIAKKERPCTGMLSFDDSFSQQREALTPRDAYFAAAERVDAEAACGRVCCELVCPYPPGIPVLVPGEKISKEVIEFLRAVVEHGGSVSGASDDSMESFLVLKKEPLKFEGFG